MTTANWYHCSVKPVSRSAGRSVVAAAAYRLGERLHDELYATVHDYTRRRGVEATFTVAPVDAPAWAHQPEALWNAAERAETRKNSTLAREVELALPSFLDPEDRQHIAEQFAAELVERYKVAVSVAIHEPSRHGDDRNYHAHILFTTRDMTPDGLGKKTRILDDRKTGPQEVIKLRELAADIINESLAAVNADVRVDHRSFKERGIDKAPTTHLGPAAAEMERRGKQTERGDINREAETVNAMLEERAALDAQIEKVRREIEERLSRPPTTREEAIDRLREDAAMPATELVYVETDEPLPTRPPTTREEALARLREDARFCSAGVREHLNREDASATSDGLRWWQRAALQISIKARSFLRGIADKARGLWQSKIKEDREPSAARTMTGG